MTHYTSFPDLENKIRAAKASSTPAPQGCRDPWITSAYQQMYHRAPQGSGDSGECNPALYGGGHWTSFPDLEAKIRAAKPTTPYLRSYQPNPHLRSYQPNPPAWQSVCSNSEITLAYHNMYARLPQGSGNSGECNPQLYGGGHWSSLADLEAKIRASKTDSGTHSPSADTLVVGRYGNLYNYWGEEVQRAGTYLIHEASATTRERLVGYQMPRAGLVIRLPRGEDGRHFNRGSAYGEVIIEGMCTGC